MQILETILGAQGGKTKSALAERFGLSEDQVGSALGKLVPALNAGVRQNTQKPGGLEALMGALRKGDHEKYLDNPELLKQDSTVDDGNAILSHVLGSKAVSRQVAQRAEAETGIEQGILKKMLPLAATMLMGGLGKNKQGLLSDESDSGGMLSKLLDSDGDGSVADDVMGMLKKMF